MASSVYGATALTGGTTGAVDSIKDAVINDGDMCIAIVGGATDACYIYTFDNSNASDESPPDIIKPDDAAGNGRWILCDLVPQDLAVQGNATIDGTLTVTGSTTLAGLSFTGDLAMGDAANLTWDSAPASDHTGSGNIITQTVDTNTYGIGGVLVLSSDGNWDDADADAEATVGRLALATESGTGSKKLMLSGIFRDDSWNWTVGGQLFVSTTVGEMTQTAPSGTGDFVQACGYALTADIIIFDPSPDYLEIS